MPSVQEVTIRPARSGELSAVLALLTDAKLPVHGVEEAFENFFVGDVDGEIVGVAGLELYGTDGLLRSVAVSPAWRGRGLGGALTDAVLRHARAQDMHNVYLLTETASDFFPRYGFRRIQRDEATPAIQQSAEFTGLCASTAVLMTRAIETI